MKTDPMEWLKAQSEDDQDKIRRAYTLVFKVKPITFDAFLLRLMDAEKLANHKNPIAKRTGNMLAKAGNKILIKLESKDK